MVGHSGSKVWVFSITSLRSFTIRNRRLNQAIFEASSSSYPRFSNLHFSSLMTLYVSLSITRLTINSCSVNFLRIRSTSSASLRGSVNNVESLPKVVSMKYRQQILVFLSSSSSSSSSSVSDDVSDSVSLALYWLCMASSSSSSVLWHLVMWRFRLCRLAKVLSHILQSIFIVQTISSWPMFIDNDRLTKTNSHLWGKVILIQQTQTCIIIVILSSRQPVAALDVPRIVW